MRFFYIKQIYTRYLFSNFSLISSGNQHQHAQQRLHTNRQQTVHL